MKRRTGYDYRRFPVGFSFPNRTGLDDAIQSEISFQDKQANNESFGT